MVESGAGRVLLNVSMMSQENSFKNKCLLITGGTGTFGNAVLERFLDAGLKEIRIFSRDEKKQEDMRIAYANQSLQFIIGDVRDPNSLDEAMQGVDYVFHAAALKQVPSCEFFPLQAIQTNSIGTGNMLDAATKNGVKKVVVLSTDKAAYPINAMGMSKALAEKITIAKARVASEKGLVFCRTRYGNVMASRGSVIPLFIDQIQSGKPLTITDPKMTRFMMSIEDAVDLVIYAFTNAEPGDLFVHKAPAATIGDVANALLKIFNAPNPIKLIGLRHGEKLYETLLTREEMVFAEDRGDYFRVAPDARDLNYTNFTTDGTPADLESSTDYNSHLTRRLDLDQTISMLLGLPEVKCALETVRSTV